MLVFYFKNHESCKKSFRLNNHWRHFQQDTVSQWDPKRWNTDEHRTNKVREEDVKEKLIHSGLNSYLRPYHYPTCVRCYRHIKKALAKRQHEQMWLRLSCRSLSASCDEMLITSDWNLTLQWSCSGTNKTFSLALHKLNIIRGGCS